MFNTLRITIATAALTAAALGLAGPAVAGPANLCDPHSVDANGMCQFHASGVLDDIDLVFPSDYPQQQNVVDYLDTVVAHYNVESGPADGRTSAHALEVTGTRYTSAGTRSVVLEIYQNTGGPHPMSWFKAFNYDTTTQKPVSFDELFRPDTAPAATLLPIVQQDLSRQFGQPVTIPAAAGLNPANYHDFAVTDDTIVFFFDQNQLLPASEASQVSVPRSEIQGLLSE